MKLKRRAKNILKAAGLLLVGSYLMMVAIFNIVNAWFSATMYYEFLPGALARFSKWNLGCLMLVVFGVGYFLAAAGATYFSRRFKKTRMYAKLSDKSK